MVEVTHMFLQCSSSSSNPTSSSPLQTSRECQIEGTSEWLYIQGRFGYRSQHGSNSSQHNGSPLQIGQWDLTVESDASKKCWGASCQEVNTGSPWSGQERAHHINYLELLAAFLALKSFASKQRAISILLRLDNITAIAFLFFYSQHWLWRFGIGASKGT